MSMMTVRRTSAGAVVATAAAAGALLLVNVQAQARNIYACVQGDGSTHIFTKKPKCKGGEKLVDWGSKAPRGPEGLPGPLGLLGPTGAAGATGSKGATGSAGATGAKGVTGATGVAGPTGPTGASGPSHVTRVVGSAVEVTGAVGSISGEATATCGEGTLVGGGATTSFNGPEYQGAIIDSYPASATSWGAKTLVTRTGATGSVGVTAYALCAD